MTLAGFKVFGVCCGPAEHLSGYIFFMYSLGFQSSGLFEVKKDLPGSRNRAPKHLEGARQLPPPTHPHTHTHTS